MTMMMKKKATTKRKKRCRGVECLLKPSMLMNKTQMPSEGRKNQKVKL